MTHPVRRNFAHLSAAERQAYIASRATSRPACLLRRRVLLGQAGPDPPGHPQPRRQLLPPVAPRAGQPLRGATPAVQSRCRAALLGLDGGSHGAASDGQGGTVDLLRPRPVRAPSTDVERSAWPSLHNGGTLAGQPRATPATRPTRRRPSSVCKSPGRARGLQRRRDHRLVERAAQAQQWTAFRQALESDARLGHGYIGGDIGGQHQAFEDPFVFLLHSNVDRLFAMWQTQPGEEWRLDPDQVYGDQSNTNDSDGILHSVCSRGTARSSSAHRSSRGSAARPRSRSRTAAIRRWCARPATTRCR